MKKFKIKAIVRENVRKLKAYQAKEIPCRVKLDANESPFPIKIEQITKEINFSLNRYPDPEATELRKALGKKFKIPYKKIMVGNGSDELIYYLVLTFGGPVLYPVPTFVMYGIISKSVGVETIQTKLDDSFDLDEREILEQIKRKKPKLIFLSTPNNPTGNTFSSDRILKVIDFARKNSTIVAIDEAYYPFSSERGFLPLLKDYENIVILRTLSKIGFAALRLGYLIANEEILSELNKVRLPYNVDALTQYIAKEALNGMYAQIKKFVDLIVKERERVYKELSNIKGIKVYPSEANFILFKVKNAKEIYKRLMQKGILIRDISSSVKDALRVTIGTKQENDEFLETLKKILRE